MVSMETNLFCSFAGDLHKGCCLAKTNLKKQTPNLPDLNLGWSQTYSEAFVLV